MLRRFLDHTTYMVCAKVDNDVAGIAIWAPPSDMKTRTPWYWRLYRIALSVYDTVTAYVYPDWLRKRINTAEYTELQGRTKRRENIMKLDDDIKQKCLPEDMKDESYWTLAVLGVSEEYGRRGIGTKLLQWGFDQADKDDRAIFVSASQDGTALYLKTGFEVLHREAEAVYDPIRGWVDQTYLVRRRKSERTV